MAVRTTIPKVKAIISTNQSDPVITAMISSANVFVSNALSGAGLSGSVLTEIETWITAHMLAMGPDRHRPPCPPRKEHPRRKRTLSLPSQRPLAVWRLEPGSMSHSSQRRLCDTASVVVGRRQERKRTAHTPTRPSWDRWLALPDR